MDDGLEKAIGACNDAFYELGKSIFEAARDMGERMKEELSDIDKLYQSLCDIDTFVDELMKKIKDRSAERKKWRRCSSVRVFTFLYDKRGKVHRCRNNC